MNETPLGSRVAQAAAAQPGPSRRRQFLLLFLRSLGLTAVPLAALLAGLTWWIWDHEYHTAGKSLAAVELVRIENLSHQLRDSVRGVAQGLTTVSGDPSVIRFLQTEDTDPSLDLADRLARFLGLNPDYLGLGLVDAGGRTRLVVGCSDASCRSRLLGPDGNRGGTAHIPGRLNGTAGQILVEVLPGDPPSAPAGAVIRVSAVVGDGAGRVRGAVVLAVHPDLLLHPLREAVRRDDYLKLGLADTAGTFQWPVPGGAGQVDLSTAVRPDLASGIRAGSFGVSAYTSFMPALDATLAGGSRWPATDGNDLPAQAIPQRWTLVSLVSPARVAEERTSHFIDHETVLLAAFSLAGLLALAAAAFHARERLAFARLRRREAELERSEQGYRSLAGELDQRTTFLKTVVDGFPLPLFVKDTGGRFVLINAAFANLVGRPEETLRGITIDQITTQEVVLRAQEQERDLIAQGGTATYEFSFVPMGGQRPIDLRIHKTAFHDPDGSIGGFLGMAVDITLEKQAAEIREASERHLRRVLDSLIAYSAVLAPDGTVLEVNRPALALAGMPHERAVGQPLEQASWWKHSREARDAVRQAIERAARGETSRFDLEARSSQGELLIIDSLVQPLRDERGQVTHVIVSGVDVTDRRRTQEKLREARDFFRLVLDTLPNPAFIKDEENRFIAVNHALSRFDGRPADALLGRTNATLVPGPQAERSDELDRQAWESTEPVVAELRTVTTHGSEHWMVARIAAISLPTGKRFLVGVLTDITERKRIEDDLAASQRKISKIIEASPAVIYSITSAATGEATFVSPHVEALTGHPVQAFLETPGFYFELIHPEDRPATLDAIRQVPETGQLGIEYRLRHADGSWRWVRDEGRLVRDEQGRPTQIIGSVLDITRRKRTEQQLLEANTFLQAVMNCLPSPLYIKDEGHRYVAGNRHLSAFIGRTDDEVFGKSDLDLFPDEDARALRLADDIVLADQQPLAQEMRIVDRSGREKWILNHKTAITLPDGRRFVVGLATDLTRRREMEEELRAARTAAEAANHAKSSFLATMSHEIRTPLNGVIVMTGLLLDSRLLPDQREIAETIRRSGEALLAIVNDVLDFSKIEAGRLEIDRSPYPLRRLIEETIEFFTTRARARHLDLACRIAPEVPEVAIGDGNRVRQVLINLLGNAVKFTDRGGVTLSADTTRTPAGAPMVRIEVRDTGIGISPERLPLLFTDFIQVAGGADRRRGDGSGLGLAICKRLCALMGGQIAVDSGPDQGSRFWFELPLAQPEPSAPAQVPALPRVRVLVVEPAPLTAGCLRQQLSDWGLSAVITADPGTALAMIAGESFDVCLLAVPAAGTTDLLGRCAGLGVPVIGLTQDFLRPEDLPAGGLATTVRKPARPSVGFDAQAQALGVARLAGEIRGASPPAARHGLQPPGPSRRILVAEDHEVNQDLVRRLLTADGHRVDLVEDGAAALTAVQATPYDLVLMDLQMPVMGGLEAVAAIRALGGPFATLPVIALTANVTAGMPDACRDAGMNGYLPKPLDRQELTRVVERWTAGWRAPAPVSTPVAADADALDHRRLDDLALALGMDGLQTLLRRLETDAAVRLDRIEAAATAEDLAALAREVHGLMSAAANLGLAAVRRKSAEVETAVRDGNGTAARAAAAELRALFRTTSSAALAHSRGALATSPAADP